MSINYSELNHAYVLDNGNGNLMAYRIDLRVAPEKRVAEPIVDQHGEPAGYALKPNGDMLLQDNMFSLKRGKRICEMCSRDRSRACTGNDDPS